MIDWKPLAQELSDHLAYTGHLHTPDWRRIFAVTPRHEFIPHYFQQREAGQWERVDGTDPNQRERWLQSVYANATLVTALESVALPADAGYDSFAVAVSSSTEPGLMAQMLEDLDVQAGDTVLEIGTGTGYNTALLCERLDDTHVFSVDLRPDQVAAAASALAHVGFRPTLVAGDGADGLADYGPFDRIIATCSVQHVPAAWIEQLRPGGLLLADVEGTIYAGNLAELHRLHDTAVEGRFSARYGSFMPMQHRLGIEPGRSHPTDARTTSERTTALTPALLHERHKPFAFYAQLHLPAGTQLQLVGVCPATRLVAPDGSWCEVDHHPDEYDSFRVVEGGPQRLWRAVEQAHDRYVALGHPGWQRFGITATPTGQHVWLDNPDSSLSWPIAMTDEP